MPGPNVLDPSIRSGIIQEIKQEENHSRKREMQKRFDVYRDRQDRYILERLEDEFSSKDTQQMRKILSINVQKRIIDEKSSLYNTAPEREWINVSENEAEQLDNLYRFGMVDSHMRQANKWFNLFHQCALWVMPRDGVIVPRVLGPHQYDVIPDSENPEKAFAYVLNVWDFDLHKSFREGDMSSGRKPYFFQDRANQKIADDNDRMAKQNKFVWWTDEFHFTTDQNGNLTSEIMINPIGELPFVDIAMEKDFQFFVRRGSSVTEFALEWSVCMSDLANINRLQGYAQAIITSDKEPKGLTVGPQKVIWLKLDKNTPEITPTFQFASPSPDLAGSLSILETKLKTFMAAEGIDPATISGGAEGGSRTFSSGIERMLAMLDKFEATRGDMDLFKRVEDKLLDKMVLWSNAFQGVGEEERLIDELNTATINDKAMVDVQFHSPEAIQSATEKLANIEKRLDLGLMTKVEAIMEDRDVSKEKAEEIMEEIESSDKLELPQVIPFGGNADGREEGELSGGQGPDAGLNEPEEDEASN